MIEHAGILIKGRVQGVFFRKYTVEQALTYHISGYVKNTEEGHVFVEAEGKLTDLEKFIAWCHKGSPLAAVKEVVVTPGEIKGYKDFSIKR